MAGEGCTSDLVVTEIPQPFGQNFVDQCLLDWEMAWPFFLRTSASLLKDPRGCKSFG